MSQNHIEYGKLLIQTERTHSFSNRIKSRNASAPLSNCTTKIRFKLTFESQQIHKAWCDQSQAKHHFHFIRWTSGKAHENPASKQWTSQLETTPPLTEEVSRRQYAYAFIFCLSSDIQSSVIHCNDAFAFITQIDTQSYLIVTKLSLMAMPRLFCRRSINNEVHLSNTNTCQCLV